MMKRLIERCGGRIEDDIFVVEPGCMIISRTRLTEEGLDITNNDPIFSGPMQVKSRECVEDHELEAAFNAKLCYMTAGVDDQKLLERIRSLGHLSVYASHYVTFVVCGVSDEIVKEFVAHGEAKVSRLTSSKCRAQRETLYRVWGHNENEPDKSWSTETQKKFIMKFLELRKEFVEYCGDSRKPDEEMLNMFNLGMKVGAFTFCMSLKDYHKLFIGRIPEHGNEHDVRLVCKKMCQQLHALYPSIISEPSAYETKNNNEKYGIN
jgi:hypothetical protein